MGTVDHRLALGKPALAWRTGQKIVLQRQLSDPGMEHRQGDRWSVTIGAAFRSEHSGRTVQKLPLPLGDLVGVNPPRASLTSITTPVRRSFT
jgi:hypothetical protein